MLPLGGYVKMFGEDPFTKQKIPKKNKKYSFSDKKLYQRFIIVFSGPLANFIFGIVGYALLYTFIGISFTPPIIKDIQKDSPAMIAGLEPGDEILSIDNKKIDNFRDIGTYLNIQKKENFNLNIKRDNLLITKPISPIKKTQDFYGQKREILIIGISSFEPERIKYNIFYSLYLGTKSTYEICSLTLFSLYQMIIGKGNFDDLGGPVKIAHFSGKMMEQGFLSFINLIILLSISIGLINLFPIPVLDGGHLVMYCIEGILGKPINENLQKKIYKIGFSLLITLAILLTYNDIIGLFSK